MQSTKQFRITKITPSVKYYVCKIGNTWWRHQIETSSALLAICAGNSPVPVNSPHKSQWRGALIFSLILAWINGWANNREAGNLRRNCAHYDVIVMKTGVNHRMSSIHILYLTVAQTSNAYSIVNSSLPGQNGRHFADDIFKCTFMNENFVFWFEFHWSLFLRVQLTISQHWFR